MLAALTAVAVLQVPDLVRAAPSDRRHLPPNTLGRDQQLVIRYEPYAGTASEQVYTQEGTSYQLHDGIVYVSHQGRVMAGYPLYRIINFSIRDAKR
jgi:hypothetical protein